MQVLVADPVTKVLFSAYAVDSLDNACSASKSTPVVEPGTHAVFCCGAAIAVETSNDANTVSCMVSEGWKEVH